MNFSECPYQNLLSLDLKELREGASTTSLGNISVFLYKALRPYKHTGIFVRSILSTLVLSRGIWWCAYCNYWHEGRVAKHLVSATKVSNSDNINVLHSL